MIASILDNDLYKFSMGYAYMKLYPQAEGRFEFNDRNNTKFGIYILEQLHREFKKLSELSLSDEAVLTIGSIHGGNAGNAIPDTVELSGTIRTYDEEIREFLKTRMTEISQGIAVSFPRPHPF